MTVCHAPRCRWRAPARRAAGPFGSRRPPRQPAQTCEAIAGGSRARRPCSGVSGAPRWPLSARRRPRRPARRQSAITSFSILPRAARTSRYSSSFASGSRKFASNCVFVYAGSMTETRMPLRAQLVVERFRIAFDRVLGRGIERPVRHRQEAEHRADVDDAAAPLPSHVRHDGTRHPDDARRSWYRRSTGPARSSSLPRRPARHRSRRCSPAGRCGLPAASAPRRRLRPIHRWSRRAAASRTIAGPTGRRVCWCRRPCSPPSRAAPPWLRRCLTRRR